LISPNLDFNLVEDIFTGLAFYCGPIHFMGFHQPLYFLIGRLGDQQFCAEILIRSFYPTCKINCVSDSGNLTVFVVEAMICSV